MRAREGRVGIWLAVCVLAAAFAAGAARAQAEEPAAAPESVDEEDTKLAKQLQNPLASLISVPFQLNYDDGFGPRDAGRWTLNIQPVIPIEINEEWNLISRTIFPVIYQGRLSDRVGSEFGLGDTVQSLFFSPKEPVGGWILGAGPVLLLPTGTEELFRREQLGLGPTAVALRQQGGWTYGALVNHIWGVTGPGDDRVNATFLQPFLSYTFPTATSLTINSESTYDWDADQWNLPINVMVSQVLPVAGRPVSFQLGGRYWAETPDGGADWGLRMNVTLLFPKR